MESPELAVIMPDAMKEKVRRVSKAYSLSMSSWARMILQAQIDRWEDEHNP
jgi:TPP-dependent indolepyruvate ferredoxin oxidoreductase alpha subunit